MQSSDPQFKFEVIKENIGARVLNSKEELLSGVLAEKIMELLEIRGVLVFPEIHFTDEEHVAFTTTLGTFAREIKGDDIYKVTLDETQNASVEYLKGVFYWHIDGYVSLMPIRASLLASKVLASSGGNTEFSNTYAAYEALDGDDKELLDSLTAVHSVATTLLYHKPEPTLKEWKDALQIGRKELPLVWEHLSGRKSLVIGNSAHAVMGMDPLKSTELLIKLRDLATQPELTYSHEWKVGDLVMWDNTGTLHRAMPYPLDCGRMLHRTKIEGDEPIQ